MTQDLDEFLETLLKRSRARRSRKKKCSARTRSGAPCQAPGNGRGDRCKLHGGKSTGPRTPEGRERARQAVLRRWQNVRSAGLQT